MPKKASGTYDVDGITMFNAKLDSLVKILGSMGTSNSVSNPTLNCDFCGGAHMNDNCTNVEQAQYMANFNRKPHQSNPYSNTYNAGWRNHHNFAWKDQGNQGSSARPPYSPGFEQRQFQQESKQPWEVANNINSERLDRLEASIKNMEIQIGQLTNSINPRAQENLPSQIEINPKEHCKAVTLRSGKQLGQVSGETMVID